MVRDARSALERGWASLARSREQSMEMISDMQRRLSGQSLAMLQDATSRQLAIADREIANSSDQLVIEASYQSQQLAEEYNRQFSLSLLQERDALRGAATQLLITMRDINNDRSASWHSRAERFFGSMEQLQSMPPGTRITEIVSSTVRATAEQLLAIEDASRTPQATQQFIECLAIPQLTWTPEWHAADRALF